MKKVIWGLLGLAVLSGCGVLKPARHEEVSGVGGQIAASDAASLNLRIVRAGERDADLPDTEFDLKSERVEDKISISGDQIVFENNQNLQDEKRPQQPFLVWPSEWLGQKIIFANIEHRVLDEQGKYSGLAQPLKPIQDLTSHWWYLPFSSFARSERADADPAFQHELVLHLELADQSVHVIQVRLRVVGAVPKLNVQEVDRFDVASWSEETDGSLQKTVVVRNTHVENSISRPLKIWIRAETIQPILSTVYLGQQTYGFGGQSQVGTDGVTYYLGFHTDPVPLPIHAWVPSSAKLWVSAVRVVLSSQPRAVYIDMKPGTWASVTLGIGEKADFQWLAVPRQNGEGCAWPDPVRQHMSWRNLACRDIVMKLCGPLDFDKDDPFVPGGSKANGEWSEGFLVENAWGTPPSQFELNDRPVDLHAGVTPEQLTAPLKCQGLF